MARTINLLQVEDSDADAALVLRELKRAKFNVVVTRVETEAEMQAALDTGTWDVILSDYALPQFSGAAALELVRSRGLDIPFIIVSGTIGEEVAVEAMKLGAQDYIMKGNMTRLNSAVERALADHHERRMHRDAETALKQTNQQLLQLQKMDAIGNLAGGVAHDFNNLLSLIIGYGEMVLGHLPPDDPHRKAIETIVSTGERGAALTRQLLAISRRKALSAEPLDLNNVVMTMEDMLRRILGENIRLHTRLIPTLGAVVADRSQIEQVVLNLVINARDAMPDGGQLLIETADVELDEDYARSHALVTPGKYVMLAVSDTGTGIPAEILSRIFEPFFTTKSSGTGLGLSTVFGIAKQSGGHVWVYSEVNKGTSFKVYFPRSESTARDRTTASPTFVAAGFGETILLVEDQQLVRELIREILLDARYTILEASDAETALEILRTHPGPIHLLATDVVMPKINGPELAVKALKLKPDLRVLFLSGYTANHLEIDGSLDGAYGFLEKPFTPKSLTRKLREILGGSV